MRYTNGGPNTLYVLVDVARGLVVETFTNLRHARQWMKEYDDDCVVLSYDQRGTR